MIARGIAGPQINDAAVSSGLQVGSTESPVEDFAQIFQQKTRSPFATSLSVNRADDAPITDSLSSIKPASPIKEEPELAAHPSASETVLKTVQQVSPSAGKSLVASPREQIIREGTPRALAETTSSADTLTPKVESASGQPSPETKPSALPKESQAAESIQIARPVTERVVPPMTSVEILSPVQTATGTKSVATAGSGRKDNADKAVDTTRKEQVLNHKPQTENAALNNAPAELILSSVSLATSAQTSPLEVNQTPTQQLQSSLGWRGEPGHVQVTSVTSGIAVSAENSPLNQQVKNPLAVVLPSALNSQVRSAERPNLSTNPIASRRAVDSQSAASVPAFETLPLAVSGHPAALAAVAGASVTDQSPMDAVPVQAMTVAATHSSVSHPHAALPNEGLSDPLEAMSMPGMANTTLSATPTRLEVGVASSSHGWLKIRAELTENGEVNASLTGGSPGAAEKLRSELPALSSYLQGEKIQVSSISIHTAVVAAPASSAEAQPSSALFERSGADSTFGLVAGFGEGRQDGQPQQPSGDASSKQQPSTQDGVEAAGHISSSVKDAGAYEVEQRQGLDGSAALPSVEYGAGGGWLNVRA